MSFSLYMEILIIKFEAVYLSFTEIFLEVET